MRVLALLKSLDESGPVMRRLLTRISTQSNFFISVFQVLEYIVVTVRLIILMRTFLIFLFSVCFSEAELKNSSKGGLNSDPSVVYAEEVTDTPLRFRVKEERPVYSDKNGKRRVGTMKVGTICELIGFDHRAFKIKGEANHSRVTGWVSPHALECQDPEFVENFKKLYERKLLVKELIMNQELAIGMSPFEVELVKGEPTKKSMRQTAKGSSGTYEYLDYERVKHYNTVQDPETGQIYRTHSHTTDEIKERIAVEFTDGAVSAIEKEEDHSSARRGPRVVTAPLYLDWGHYYMR